MYLLEIDRTQNRIHIMLSERFDEPQAKSLLEKKLLFPAYEYVLKSSHIFNLLDARGVVSVTERPAFIKRVRDLANGCARLYLKTGNVKC